MRGLRGGLNDLDSLSNSVLWMPLVRLYAT